MQIDRLKDLPVADLQAIEAELEDLQTSRAWLLVRARLRDLQEQETRSCLSSRDAYVGAKHAGAALGYETATLSPQDMLRDVRMHLTNALRREVSDA